MVETTRWISWTAVVALLALALQLGGYVAPMWIYILTDNNWEVHVGLFYAEGCGFDDSCTATAPDLSFGYSSDDTFGKAEFKAVMALQTLGVAGGVLLLLFLVVLRVGHGYGWDRMGQLRVAAFLASILTWLVIIIGLVVYCAFYWAVVGTSPLVSSISFPWSLLLCLFAAFFFIIVTWMLHFRCRHRDYTKHAIPTSGDSKFDLNPVTKHGIVHRYFTPSHYNDQRRDFAIAPRIDTSAVASMERRLLAPEAERTVAAIDNVTFQTVDPAVRYQYLPIPNSNHNTTTMTHTDISRRALPPAPTPSTLISYVDNGYQPQQQQQHQNQLTHTHVTESRVIRDRAENYASRAVDMNIPPPQFQPRSDVIQQRVNHDVTRDYAFQHVDNPQVSPDVTRDYSFQNGDVRTTRDVTRDYSFQNGDVRTPRDVTRDYSFQNGDVRTTRDVTRDYSFQNDAVRASHDVTVEGFQRRGGMTQEANYRRDDVVADDAPRHFVSVVNVLQARDLRRPTTTTTTSTSGHLTEERVVGVGPEYTAEGRMRANSAFHKLNSQQHDPSEAESASQRGGVLLRYTTHTLGQETIAGPRVVTPPPDARGYDPSYIYRPYFERQIY